LALAWKNLWRGDAAAAAQWAGRAELDDMSGSNFSEFDVRLKDSNESLDRILDEQRAPEIQV
jgi:hypothetical protein